jgi:hypothetical protein
VTTTFKWHGPKAKAAARRGAVRGLKLTADHVLEGAGRLVPVAPIGGGFLRDSGKASVDESALRAAVSYDSPPGKSDGRNMGAGSLAIWVHEDMTARHGVGQAKYLEAPVSVARAEKTLDVIVAREIKAALG